MISASVGKRPIGCLELTMSSALQLPVEFIEREIAEQGRKWSPLRGALYTAADQPVLHHPGV
jgi:hypothetical protein